MRRPYDFHLQHNLFKFDREIRAAGKRALDKEEIAGECVT
jgi:hypothetical protein